MTLKVIGAGIGRTGTLSLKIALEQLLESPCYHMVDVFSRPEDIPIWKDAALGKIPNWQKLLDGFQGALDEPPALFWPELSKAYPEAHVLLSL